MTEQCNVFDDNIKVSFIAVCNSVLMSLLVPFRFEMPYNIWCGGCGIHIGMGNNFTAVIN